MEYRSLGSSGLKVPAVSFGAGAVTAAYPYYLYRVQEGFARLNPPLV